LNFAGVTRGMVNLDIPSVFQTQESVDWTIDDKLEYMIYDVGV